MTALTDTEYEGIETHLLNLLKDAVELRFGPLVDGEGTEIDEALLMPEAHEGPNPFVHFLLRARQRSDRVEEIMATVKKVRRRVAADKRDADAVLEDKLNEQLDTGAKNKAEFSMADERRAAAAIGAFVEKRAARSARGRLETVDAILDAVKDIHWGLSGVREDTRTILRSFQLESNLERG